MTEPNLSKSQIRRLASQTVQAEPTNPGPQPQPSAESERTTATGLEAMTEKFFTTATREELIELARFNFAQISDLSSIHDEAIKSKCSSADEGRRR